MWMEHLTLISFVHSSINSHIQSWTNSHSLIHRSYIPWMPLLPQSICQSVNTWMKWEVWCYLSLNSQSLWGKHIRSYKIVIQHCHSCGVGKPWFYVNKESISSDLGSEIFPDEMPCKLRSDL